MDDQFDRAYSTHSKQQTDTIELSVCSAVRALTHHKYNVNANTNTNYNFNDNEYYNDNDDEYTE